MGVDRKDRLGSERGMALRRGLDKKGRKSRGMHERERDEQERGKKDELEVDRTVRLVKE